MPAQMSLPGLEPSMECFEPDPIQRRTSGPPLFNLFAALVPDREDADRMQPVVTELLRHDGLTGAPVPAERQHVTLVSIAMFIGPIPLLTVDAARTAVARVSGPPLSLVFDRVLTFTGNKTPTFVTLCDAASDAGIARLRQKLAHALKGLKQPLTLSRTPHMSLQYGPRQEIAEHAIEPLRWTARRFALVLSHYGEGHHQWIDERPLDAPA